MRSLLGAAAGVSLSLAAALAWAHSATPLSQVPFAGYGDAHMRRDCILQVTDGAAWSSECRLSGKLVGDGFTVSLNHAFRLGSTGCALALQGAHHEASIACRRLGQQFGIWIEVSEILGTPCRAVGTVWSRVAAESEDDPLFYVVTVELELLIEPGQALCDAGTWNETRYYLVCAEQPDPAFGWASVHERVCSRGVELLTLEAVHRKPEGTDKDNPWHRRLFAHVRS